MIKRVAILEHLPFQPNVLGFYDTLPSSPVEGDRVILVSDQCIKTYYESSWISDTPEEGWRCTVLLPEPYDVVFRNGEWVIYEDLLETEELLTEELPTEILPTEEFIELDPVFEAWLDTDPLSGFVLRSGDTMTGFLTLHADPEADLHAVTKQYLDGVIPDLAFPSGEILFGNVTNDGVTSSGDLLFEDSVLQIDGDIQVLQGMFSTGAGLGKIAVSDTTGFLVWTDPSSVLSGYVPTSRTLTMSASGALSVSPTGAQDLSANRSWAFSHSTADGYLHVPATGTTNNGKFLQAGATAGSLSWVTIPSYSDNYVDTLSFSTSTGLLTLGRTGSLADLTYSLDGRFQLLDADLTAIAALTGTTGFLKKTAANTWALDTVGGGYTNLTQFTDQTAWRIFYSDDAGEVQELAFGSAGQYLRSLGAGVGLTWSTPTGSGTVTSVAMSIPTGFSISGSPITTSGTLGLGFASGYSLPTNLKQGQWDAAYMHSLSAHQTIINGTGFVKASGTTLSYDNSTYDNYGGWSLYVGGVNRGTISAAEVVNFAAGTNVSLGYSSTNNTITINSSGGGDMVYPAAGVGISSGSAWLTPATGTVITGNTDDKLLYSDDGTWKYITVPDFVLGQTAQATPLSTDYLWLTRLTDSFAKESYKVRLSVLSTFFGSGGASISDDAYSSSWNAVTDIGASKNAIYDKIETLANNNLSNLGTTQIYVSLLPGTSSSFDLGSSTYKWRDLYLGGDASIGDDLLLTSSGAVINFYGGDVLLTHSTNKLTVSGGAFVVAGHSGGSDTNRDIPEVINVCYGTDNTPPTTAPEGTLYIQYY